jgi:hypothetical protein
VKVRELTDRLEQEFNPDDDVYATDDRGWLHDIYIGDDEWSSKKYLTIEPLSERVIVDEDDEG